MREVKKRKTCFILINTENAATNDPEYFYYYCSRVGTNQSDYSKYINLKPVLIKIVYLWSVQNHCIRLDRKQFCKIQHNNIIILD